MLLGAILTAIGIVALAFQSGLHYKSRERFPPNSSTQVTTHEEKVISISPVIGVAALAGGVAVMILAAKR